MLTHIKSWFKPKPKENIIPSSPVQATELTRFRVIHGERGSKVLSIAGKHLSFYLAIKSSMGKEILHDSMIQMERLLEKIIKVKATKEELAEYRVLRKIVSRWSDRIALYEQSIQTIKES